MFLVIFFIFGLSGCTNPLPQHSKKSLKDYAKEKYGHVDKVVSFEDTEESNIVVIEDKLGFTYEVVSRSSEVSFDGASFGYSVANISDNYIEKYFEYLLNSKEIQGYFSEYNLSIDDIYDFAIKLIDNNNKFDEDLAYEYTKKIHFALLESDEYNLFNNNINIYVRHKDTYDNGGNHDFEYDTELEYLYEATYGDENIKSESEKEELKNQLKEEIIDNSMVEFIITSYGECEYLGLTEINPKDSPAIYEMLDDAINYVVGNEKYSSMLESCPVYCFENTETGIIFYVVKSEFTTPSYTMCDFVYKLCEYYSEELDDYAKELGGTSCRFKWSQEGMKLDLYIDNGLDRFDLDLNELKKLRYVEDSVEDLLRIENSRVLNNLNIMIYYE